MIKKERQIKFRAWIKSWKRMVKVSDIDFYTYDDNNEPSIGILDYHSQASFKDIELMQFTGLTDTNGVDVYAGDLLLVDGHRTVKVIWHDRAGCWDVKVVSDTDYDIEFKSLKNNEWKWRTVKIGNIHENKELLK